MNGNKAGWTEKTEKTGVYTAMSISQAKRDKLAALRLGVIRGVVHKRQRSYEGLVWDEAFILPSHMSNDAAIKRANRALESNARLINDEPRKRKPGGKRNKRTKTIPPYVVPESRDQLDSARIERAYKLERTDASDRLLYSQPQRERTGQHVARSKERVDQRAIRIRKNVPTKDGKREKFVKTERVPMLSPHQRCKLDSMVPTILDGFVGNVEILVKRTPKSRNVLIGEQTQLYRNERTNERDQYRAERKALLAFKRAKRNARFAPGLYGPAF